MAVLLIADHDGKALKPGVTNAVTAATKMGGPLVLLVQLFPKRSSSVGTSSF